MTDWAGTTSAARGKQYQRRGAVRDIAHDEDGRLLAGVLGTRWYAVRVSIESGEAKGARRRRIDSACKCPVGTACKHAVAAIMQLLEAIVGGVTVPIVSPDN